MPSKSSGSTLLKPSAAKVKPPPMFKVVMYNDDFTPMEFVVEVLQTFFSLPREQATQVMLKVHTEGRGVCGRIRGRRLHESGAGGSIFAPAPASPAVRDGGNMIAQELEVSLHMAFVEARQKRHEFITVEHLLLALCDNRPRPRS